MIHHILKRLSPKVVLTSCRYYAKNIKFGREARSMLLEGVDVLANAVGTTMGPKGRTAIIEKLLISPQITKDGVTVANAVSLEDNCQNMGVKLVKDVGNKTNNSVGDGSSTAMILARAILKNGLEDISRGANAMEIRRGIILATAKVSMHLKNLSKSIHSPEQLEHIARISANGDMKIAELIHKGVSELGLDAVFVVKDGKTTEDELEIIKGIYFDEGFIAPHFINTTKGAKVEYSDALVLLSLAKISSLSKILPALHLSYVMRRPLIIIAESVEGEALSTLVVNKLRQNMQICAVKAPEFGENRIEIMKDIAVATGGMLFDSHDCIIPLEKLSREHFGEVSDVCITRNRTILMRGRGPPTDILQRIQYIRQELQKEHVDTARDRLNQRLGRLTSGIAVLQVGGSSQVEVNEKKDRIHGALNAMRAAFQEGIVPGGGVAYLRCIPILDNFKGANPDQDKGIRIMRDALRIPCLKIAENAGVDGTVVVNKIMEQTGDYGYDVLRDEYTNLIERNIIDSTKMARIAITSAAGMASLLLTAEAVITEAPKEQTTSKKSNQRKRSLLNMMGM